MPFVPMKQKPAKYKAVVYLNVDTDVEARDFIESAIRTEIIFRNLSMEVDDFEILILDSNEEE